VHRTDRNYIKLVLVVHSSDTSTGSITHDRIPPFSLENLALNH